MPEKKSPSLTLGDLLKRASNIKTIQILYVLLLVAVFILGYLIARVQMLEKKTTDDTTPKTQVGQQPSPQTRIGVDPGKLAVKGKDNAKVTIVEFTDFECPFCERFFNETLPQIEKEYIKTGKAKLYVRHFPLDFHAAAMPAALASECANIQGKFWEYHNKIFAEQEKIAGKTAEAINIQLKTFAKNLRLNTSQFDVCLDNETKKENVTNDLNDGKAAGVSGTPTFFINGRKVVGAQPFSAFKAIIDEELKK